VENQTTLFQLASDLFLFLVTFRRKIRKGVSIHSSEVRSRLETIFAEQEAVARSDPSLSALYEKAKYPLVVLADEILLTCDWEFASEWEAQTMEERYFGSRIAGDEFFYIVDRLRDDETELAQILYTCLCMGFRGRYRQDSEELRTLRNRLYRQIPEYMAGRTEKLCPEAYHVSEGSTAGLTPLVNLARVAIVCVVFLIVYFTASQVSWNSITKEIREIADGKTIQKVINPEVETEDN